MKHLKFLLPLFLFVVMFNSCDDDDEQIVLETQTIADLASASPSLSSLVTALQRANLVNTLAGAGPFTVLAPDNDAFDAFLEANNFDTLEDVPVDLLTQVLLNHVISGELRSTDLSTGFASTSATSAATGTAMSIYIDTSNGVTFNGISTVRNANVEADNGVIHFVDAVIGLPTVVDLAIAADGNTNSLVDAVTAAGLGGDLSGNGPFTVLAPTNEAFSQFLMDNQFDELGDVPVALLEQVLLNHVLGASLQSTDLSTGYETTSATSDASGTAMSLYIDTSNGVRFNGVSSVDLNNANIIANNGVIHIVDAVIGLPTVVTFATADPTFSTLVTALTTETPMTDFAGILSRTMTGNSDNIDPDFTVFAPTNTAFDELLDSNTMWNSLSDIDDNVLTNVLLHHVISGANVRSAALTPNGNTNATTVEGDMITITLPGTNDNIADVTDGSGNTGAGIIVVDVQANNGVIHVLNTVLLPN